MKQSKLFLPFVGLLFIFSLTAVGCPKQPATTTPTISEALDAMEQSDGDAMMEESKDDEGMMEEDKDGEAMEESAGGAMMEALKEGESLETTKDMEVMEESKDGDAMMEEGEDTAMKNKTIPATTIKKAFEMVARQWAFEPATITVNEGDTVVINIKSTDVAHGIAISAFGVNEKLEPGKVTKVQFIADKKGTFPFVCSVFCGSGHGAMRGTLIVE